MSTATINRIIKDLQDLMPLPSIMRKIMVISRDPRSSSRDLAQVISLDQALTARLLRLCNSAFYGFSRKITSINHAITLLGFRTIESLATAAVFVRVMDKPLKGYAVEKGGLWKHSILCAFSSQLLALKRDKELKDTAFTSGLIHDIGKLILDRYLSQEFDRIIELVENRQIPFQNAEKEVLGFDHAEIGARAAEKWQFPHSLVEAIHYHHNPQHPAEIPLLVNIVHVSNSLSRMTGEGVGRDGFYLSTDEEALQSLKITEEEEQQILAEMVEKFDDALRFLSEE